MLYAKALRDGLSDLPSADPKTRERLEPRRVNVGGLLCTRGLPMSILRPLRV